MIKFSYVTLFVDDVRTARDWYVRNIGLTPVWESANFVMLTGSEGAQIGLHQGSPLAQPDRVQLHFEVPNVDAIYHKLRSAGVTFVAAPTDQPWGCRVATVRDPAGHTVELYTPL